MQENHKTPLGQSGKPVLVLTTKSCCGGPLDPSDPRCESADFYSLADLDDATLATYRGIYVAGWCDQIFLESQREKLTHFVEEGGRLFFNGHPERAALGNFPSYRKLDFRGMDDLSLHRVGEHPIWEGVDYQDLWLKTGVPGSHDIEALKKIGVAGFYARAYLSDVPAGAQVIGAIGPHKLPVDIAYPVGAGEVVYHCGLELLIFNYPDKSTKNLVDNLFAWLAGGAK
ncbi:MAG: hypothetical protein Q4G30_00375 [Actinomycetaceae bacterium]|nr:hypothetical protein [Actinomycetaceae bacterium]